MFITAVAASGGWALLLLKLNNYGGQHAPGHAVI